jgi:Uma2 family endonuclease
LVPGEWFEGAPAIAVEVLSPSNTASAMAAKVRAYLRAGAEAVLVIDPKDKSLAAYYANGRFETFEMPDGKFVNEALFPGLCIPLAVLFEGLG